MDTTNAHRLIGDVELLRPVLDGFFRDWKGIYDILLPAPDGYVFYPEEGFCPLCRSLREHPEGDELCLLCDRYYALEAAEKGRAIHYCCHAGLLDIAAPVIVNGCFCQTKTSPFDHRKEYHFGYSVCTLTIENKTI